MAGGTSRPPGPLPVPTPLLCPYYVGSIEFTCPEDSDYFPGCSDEFPVCLFRDMVCDGIVDCEEAEDEVATLCHGKIIC